MSKINFTIFAHIFPISASILSAMRLLCIIFSWRNGVLCFKYPFHPLGLFFIRIFQCLGHFMRKNRSFCVFKAQIRALFSLHGSCKTEVTCRDINSFNGTTLIIFFQIDNYLFQSEKCKIESRQRLTFAVHQGRNPNTWLDTLELGHVSFEQPHFHQEPAPRVADAWKLFHRSLSETPPSCDITQQTAHKDITVYSITPQCISPDGVCSIQWHFRQYTSV